MNKTVSINLSGQVFQIDEDAYAKLKGYLDALHARFIGTEGADEILADIEARLAEMFLESLSSRKKVVSMGDVDHVIEVMGQPEDFGDIEEEEAPTANAKTTQANTGNKNTWTGNKIHRKLYRDPDNKVIGGVLSGLSAYFGIHDPVWLRLICVLLFFLSGGTVMLAYLVMVIIVPKAETASEKLEMKGEPINVDNIERTIKENINDLNSRLTNMDKDSLSYKTRAFFTQLGHMVIDVLSFFLRLFRGIFGIIFLIGGLSAIVALVWALLLPGQVLDVNTNFLPYYFNSHAQVVMAAIGFGLLIFVPIVAFTLLGLRLLFYRSFHPRRLGVSYAGLFVVGIILALIATGGINREFSYQKEALKTIGIDQPSNNKLYLELLKDDHYNDPYFEFFNIGPLRVENDRVFTSERVQLNVLRSNDNTYHLEETVTASGPNREEAYARASHVFYNAKQTDSVLYLADYLSYPKTDKIREQKIQLTLYVPVGGSVVLGRSIRKVIYDIKNVTNTYDGDMVGHTWTMMPEGLTCVNCNQTQEVEHSMSIVDGKVRRFEVGEFKHIKVNGIFEVHIIKGDKPSVAISGSDDATKDVDVKTSGKTLSISSDHRWPSIFYHNKEYKLRIDITTPSVEQVTINGPTQVEMKDFTGDEMTVELAGASKADLDLDVKNLEVKAAGACDVTLKGSGDKLTAAFTGASTLYAFDFDSKVADLEVNGASHAQVKVSEKLTAEANGASDVEYDGSPTVSSDAAGFSSIKPRH